MRKGNACSLRRSLRAACLSAGILAAGSSLASASDFVFDLENTGTTPISVQVTVHQQSSDTLRITVDQNDPGAYGDLRGLFLHVNEAEVNLDNLDFTFVSAFENGTGNAITPKLKSSTGFNSVGFDGLKNYDIALEFGKNGKGKDDINSIAFDIVNTVGALNQMNFLASDMQYFMAARATSSWNGNDREGSSKLKCCGATTVAEPGSTMGLTALAFGGLLWRRRRSS